MELAVAHSVAEEEWSRWQLAVEGDLNEERSCWSKEPSGPPVLVAAEGLSADNNCTCWEALFLGQAVDVLAAAVRALARAAAAAACPAEEVEPYNLAVSTYLSSKYSSLLQISHHLIQFKQMKVFLSNVSIPNL